jgi:hypothetical protein
MELTNKKLDLKGGIYLLYGIKIGFEEFDLNIFGETDRMFKYCEERFGFNSEKWEEIKSEYDYELLGEMIESLGVNYEEFIE